MKYFVFFVFLGFLFISSSFQPRVILKGTNAEDTLGLEGIMVEKYYSPGGKKNKTSQPTLPKGTITYRVYVDLKPGYSLQAVYGVPGHEFFIKTSTAFFNDMANGDATGDLIDDKKINENSLAFDSWLTIGAATKSRWGAPRKTDTDGSIITFQPFSKSDGLVEAGAIPKIIYFGMELNPFHSEKSSVFSTSDGSLASFNGVKGPTVDNKILIAQLTTDGKLSFELNLQLKTPKNGVQQFVARNPSGSEILFKDLIYGSFQKTTLTLTKTN